MKFWIVHSYFCKHLDQILLVTPEIEVVSLIFVDNFIFFVTDLINVFSEGYVMSSYRARVTMTLVCVL